MTFEPSTSFGVIRYTFLKSTCNLETTAPSEEGTALKLSHIVAWSQFWPWSLSTHAPNLYIRDVLFVFRQISTLRSVNPTVLGMQLTFYKAPQATECSQFWPWSLVLMHLIYTLEMFCSFSFKYQQ